MRGFIDEGYERAPDILTERREEWERLAQGLLEYETLTGDQIERVMRGEPPTSGSDDGDGEVENKPSVTVIPKTRPRRTKPDGGEMEPEPSA